MWIINIYCFKLIGLGVTCHTAIDNAERQREERRGDGALLEEVKVTLGPEEREGVNPVKRSWVGGKCARHAREPGPGEERDATGWGGAQAAGV